MVISNPRYTTARGAALLAAYGAGIMSLDEIKSARQITQVFAPNDKLRKLYDELYTVLIKYYRNNEKIMRKINI